MTDVRQSQSLSHGFHSEKFDGEIQRESPHRQISLFHPPYLHRLPFLRLTCHKATARRLAVHKPFRTGSPWVRAPMTSWDYQAVSSPRRSTCHVFSLRLLLGSFLLLFLGVVWSVATPRRVGIDTSSVGSASKEGVRSDFPVSIVLLRDPGAPTPVSDESTTSFATTSYNSYTTKTTHSSPHPVPPLLLWHGMVR